jgi:TetR/AcrR family transcriptional repressor of mexJK operon
VARGWVAGIIRPEVTDLRLLVIGTARRFPGLARKWLGQSPQRFAPVIAAALRELSVRGEMDVPDPDLAVIQFYALTVYPHIIRSMFGIQLDPRATEDLLTSGVDMFLSYYAIKDSGAGRTPGRRPTVQAGVEAP